MKPELLPDASFLKKHLLLLPSGHPALAERKEDVAFLRYNLGGDDIMIAQTGGDFGQVHLFILNQGMEAEAGPIDDETRIRKLANAYLRTATFGTFVLRTERNLNLLFSKALDPTDPRIIRFVCLLGKRQAYFGINIAGPKGTGAATITARDGWFTTQKDLWPGVPLERFRTADRTLLVTLPDAEGRPIIPRELAQAVQQKDIKTLLGFAKEGGPDTIQPAIDALAESPEGCASLVALLSEGKIRNAGGIISALSKAGTPDALNALRDIAAANRDPDVFEESMEAVLKKMPEHEARRVCLEEAQKLAENPDADPEKLAFYMRGLGRPFDPPEVKVLRQILLASRNDKVRAAAVGQLSNWICQDADSRETVLREVLSQLGSPDPQAQQRVLRALGQSTDLRFMPAIAPLLDHANERVRYAAAQAIARLLRWEVPRHDSAEARDAWMKSVKDRAAAVVKKLTELEAISKPPGPE